PSPAPVSHLAPACRIGGRRYLGDKRCLPSARERLARVCGLYRGNEAEVPPRRCTLVNCEDIGRLAARATCLVVAALVACQPEPDLAAEQRGDLDNAGFRDLVAAHVRDVADSGPGGACSLPLTAAEPRQVVVTMYESGALVGRGFAGGDALCVALDEATER